MHDFVGAFDSVEDAQTSAHGEIAQVLDTETMRVVKLGDSQWVNGSSRNIKWTWIDPDYTQGWDYNDKS